MKWNLVWSKQAAFFCDGAEAGFTNLDARLDDTVLTGTLDVDLNQSLPAHSLDAEIKALPWKGGTLDATLTTSPGLNFCFAPALQTT
jgi:hypothetical protein